MDESILESVKKDIGINPEYEEFDSTIIGDINSVFVTLYELQVGPESVFQIESESEFWSDFTDNLVLRNMVRPYISMRVKLMFDPPSSSFVLESLNKQIAEAEWRLNVAAESASLGGEYLAGD